LNNIIILYLYNILFYFSDALLSDISYSYSEDSSYENVIKNVKHNYIPLVNVPKSPSSNTGVNTKTCEVIK
jgi:hypothetical protein